MSTNGTVRQSPPITLLTVADTQARLGVGRTTVFQLIRDGDLVAVRLSARMTRVRSDSIDAYIERVTAQASA